MMGLQSDDIGWKVKGQSWPLEIIYSDRIIRLNISIDFGFNSFQKINFSRKNPFKYIRKQIWPRR